jgi:hypothetical protein
MSPFPFSIKIKTRIASPAPSSCSIFLQRLQYGSHPIRLWPEAPDAGRFPSLSAHIAIGGFLCIRYMGGSLNFLFALIGLGMFVLGVGAAAAVKFRAWK